MNGDNREEDHFQSLPTNPSPNAARTFGSSYL